MSAVAGRSGSARRFLPAVLLLAPLAVAAAPARAEVGSSLSLISQERFRGRPVSDGDPVATLALSYDDVRGAYVGASLTTAIGGDAAFRFSSSTQYLGYARRLGGGINLDVGIANRVYSGRLSGEYASRITEGYIGLVGRRIATHVYVSPDFDGYGNASVYGEIDATLLQRRCWSLVGHLGLLAPPHESGESDPRFQPDWRLGVATTVGRIGLSASWVGTGRDHDHPDGRNALVVGASFSF